MSLDLAEVAMHGGVVPAARLGSLAGPQLNADMREVKGFAYERPVTAFRA